MAAKKTFKDNILDRVWKFLTHILPAKTYLSLKYRVIFKKKMSWSNPSTFNEKLQWSKIYGPGKEYAQYVDKVLVKRYVAETIGEEYVIPTFGVWCTEKDVDVDSLPEQFVLKCNHNSGCVVICRDKSEFDLTEAQKILRRALKNNYYLMGKEKPYKYVERRVFAEKFMQDNVHNEIRDYKFFCFDGHPQMLLIASNRVDELKLDYFDMNFNHLNLRQGYGNAVQPLEKPESFELMKTLVSKLSSGFPQVRVDMYEINEKVYFGEMTFFHFNGFMPFEPASWDDRLGAMLTLPKK